MLTTNRALLILALATLLLPILGNAQTADAQGIELESLEPRGAQRGGRFTVKFSGERLDLADKLLFFRPGLRLIEYRVTDAESAEAVLESEDDCALGEHSFMLTGPRGVSKLATVHLGPFAVVSEKEPNDRRAEANSPDGKSSSVGITVFGEIEGADIDCYRFELEIGERLSAEIEAMRLGGQFFDAYLDVVDPNGNVVASSDDTPLLKQDPLVSMVAKTKGAHTIRVREAAFDGEYGSSYQLHVGNFAQPTIAYPVGGPAGKSTPVQMLGDAGGEFAANIVVPISAAGFYFYHPNDGTGGSSPAPIRFRVSDLDNVLEAEPNNSIETATAVKSVPVACNGILNEPEDQDFFSFEAKSGEQFDVEVFGSRVGSPIDSVIEIFGPDGRLVGSNDDGVIHDSTLRFVTVESGRYVLRVADHLKQGGPTYVYRVEFQPVQPDLELRIADLDPQRPLSLPAISLPRGGRFAVLASTRRKNFSSAVELAASSLPKGVTLSVDPIDADSHLTMLLFEADQQSAVGSQLVGITAYARDESASVTGSLRQEVGLVFGEPRQTVYHSTEVDQLPLAVTDEAPFSITVEQPRAPLAQDGLQELRVLAKRRDGFDEPIELSALLLPKWIETSEDLATIESGDSIGIFPLIAKAQAAPGTYPLILVGKANVAGGEVRVASQRFEVRIDPPHATVEIALSTTEQGTNSTIECEIKWLREPEGEAVATLRGLPSHTSAPTAVVKRNSKKFAFPVTVGSETPASIHNTLFVELSVPEAGEPCRQYLGHGGTLEVFAQGERAREKRSRLEILRQKTGSIGMMKALSVP